jgi:hypothetical protein
MKGTRVLALVAGSVILSSCMTTRNSRFVEADAAARAGDFATAATEVEENRDSFYSDRDQVLYYLDSGMLNFYDREYETSISRFQEAERLIEEYFTRSVTQVAATFLLNDNAQNYSGEDFEDIYLNVFNAVSFLERGNPEGAFVEVRRINNKLNLLEDKYQGLAAQYNQTEDAAVAFEPGESRFYNSALARYLSLVMYRADGDYDGARIDWQEMQEAFARQTNLYGFPIPLDETVIEPVDGARLSVLAFTGEAPIKRAETLYVVTFDDRVDIIYANEDEQGGLIPEGYAAFYYPRGRRWIPFQVSVAPHDNPWQRRAANPRRRRRPADRGARDARKHRAGGTRHLPGSGADHLSQDGHPDDHQGNCRRTRQGRTAGSGAQLRIDPRARRRSDRVGGDRCRG